MNEELQSSNEELETMNEELRHRTLEVNDMNTFLETVLTTIGLAVAVLDRQQRVQIWNSQARELWGANGRRGRGSSTSLSLDIGLPVDQLKAAVARLPGRRRPCARSSCSRRPTGAGRAFQCRVDVPPTRRSG